MIKDYEEKQEGRSAEAQRWEEIQEHCRKLSAEILEWEQENHREWGYPWSELPVI